MEISDLLFLIDDYPDYNEFEQKYNECTTRLQSLIDELNDIDV